MSAHREDIQHQRIVQRLVRNMIKKGCPPNEISISAIQNPDIENWARRKGVIFNLKQEVDLLHPEGYSMGGEECKLKGGIPARRSIPT